MGIVTAAGSLTDFVLPAAKPGLPADGLALTGFLVVFFFLRTEGKS